MEIPLLPEELAEIIRDYNMVKDTMGCSIASVYNLESKDKNLYLKIHPQEQGLRKEHDVMKWLSNKVPVPEIVYYASANGQDYLLMTEVPGEMSCSDLNLLSPEKTVKLLAEGIKMLHSINTKDCTLYNNLQMKLSDAAKNVENNLIDLTEWKRNNTERSPESLLTFLLESQPAQENTVFTHGDYCLPNVFFKDGKVSGFIDMGHGGIADSYQDISLCIRSIRYNLGSEEYVDMFLKELNIKPDWDKINYYMLVDELV